MSLSSFLLKTLALIDKKLESTKHETFPREAEFWKTKIQNSCFRIKTSKNKFTVARNEEKYLLLLHYILQKGNPSNKYPRKTFLLNFISRLASAGNFIFEKMIVKNGRVI